MRTLLATALAFLSHLVMAQQKPVSEKALLYQVSGNGMKKTSYVYGTMHVSNKLAFYLSDTFFYALKSADVVGLETDPGKWLDQMLVSEHYSPLTLFDGTESKLGFIGRDVFDLKVSNRVLSRAMSGTPRIVNGFLYRHMESTSDFEEDTYLDLYIYQAACKLGKEVHSVEGFEESEKLVKLAKEAVTNSKTRTYVRHKSALVGENNLETAYRNGDIDMIDSLDNLMRYPQEYYENMLYKRNANMAHYMDSVMQDKSMFVGVGVSHLPGKKGLLNLLQEMGYTVKAISKINKNSPQKEAIENMNVPVAFVPYTSDDGLFSMKVPGKVYTYPKDNYSQKYLCQDMANGGYCLVTRVKTYASLFNQDAMYSLMRVDSLLYENIPGKITSKQAVTINGYQGYDLTNKTGQGKFQRHLVIAMPNEVVFFRMHGSENYIKKYGQKFIESISLSVPLATYTVNSDHGFTVQFPSTPSVQREHSGLEGVSPSRKEWILSGKGHVFYATQLVVNNTSYIDEDSFELELMAHTFADQLKGEIISKKKADSSSLLFALTDNNKDTAEGMLQINSNKVYLLYCKSKDQPSKAAFFSSFKITPVNYGSKFPYTDTTLHYKVVTYVKPYDQSKFERYGTEKEDSVKAWSVNRYFTDKNTGDEVRLHYYRYNKYEQEIDSVKYWKWRLESLNNNGDNGVTVLKRSGTGQNHTLEFVTNDTLSSRGARYKVFLRGDVAYRLSAASGSKGEVSEFVNTIFETFEPLNEFKRPSLFDDRVPVFGQDVSSKDSATKAQAQTYIDDVYFNADSSARIIRIIENLQADQKYEEIKVDLIKKLAYSTDPSVLPWLEKTYNNAEDTLRFKLAVLFTLSRIKSKPSYNLWLKLVNENMPEATEESEVSQMIYGFGIKDTNVFIRLVTPAVLKLLYIQDFKAETYSLLVKLKDKKLIKPSAYKGYLDVMLLDARRELKTQKEKEKQSWYTQSGSRLTNINKLMIPFYDNAAVKKHFDKVLQTKSDGLKINTIALIAQNNFAVTDTMVYNLASKIATRQKLFEKLKQAGKPQLFPSEFSTPEKRLDGLIYATIIAANQTSDTFIVFGNSPVNYYNSTYTVHGFKFKKTDDMVWQTGITATCANDSCYNKINNDLSGISAKYYSESLAAEKFITDEVRNIRANRKSGRYRNNYQDYESELDFDFED
ncbi:MAG: TraB/GumN family protein [Bacteroidota bacterium]